VAHFFHTRKLSMLLLALLLAYAASPAVAAWRLGRAVKARDAPTIESMVDWVSLRANIKRTLASHVANDANGATSGHLSKAIKGTLGALAVDGIVAAAITPRTLAGVLAGRNLLDDVGLTQARRGRSPESASDHDGQVGSDGDPNNSHPWGPRRLRWAFFETPTRFRIEMVHPKLPGRRIISVLALQGISWQLVDVYTVVSS
jgi:hypothetical protein